MKIPKSDAIKKIERTEKVRTGGMRRMLNPSKFCPKCNRFYKTVNPDGTENFYQNDHQSSGWASSCKNCTADYVRRRKDVPTND